MPFTNFAEACKYTPPGLKLLKKVGEGTFAAVYQCVPTDETEELYRFISNPSYCAAIDSKYLAVKCIYQQSDEKRIMREVELMFKLRNSPNVIDVLDFHRYQDQSCVVMPFVKFHEFKDFYKKMNSKMVKSYMFSLLTSLKSIHKHLVIHRDIKPSNFLYNVKAKTGCLADFGLAQIDETTKKKKKQVFTKEPSLYDVNNGTVYIDDAESRPALRAERAGTRGFRAPEVLLKWQFQTTKIDIWSVGVVLLCIMSKRYPFYHSTTDDEALLEIAMITGSRAIKDLGAVIGTCT
eukprot:NODE_45_length_27728_cov_0.328387.p7 type:complete len:292 gc:universal NODE_45_length_27728_cov_0.328387:26482-27357(+)